MLSNFLIIGSGFSGSVLAHELATAMDCHIDIWEARNHIGGNCHTARDNDTGIMIHQYGPHIFNTNDKKIWDYVNSFSEFRPYVHRVKAVAKGNIFSFPINLLTFNQYFKKSFTPVAAQDFLKNVADTIFKEPGNFEEQALSFIGDDLYKTFFYGYTKKQWGCDPKELPASIMKRIPIRFNYDENYHDSLFTGIPVNGYSHVIEKLLRLPNIDVYLNKKFNSGIEVNQYDHIFYTGPIDGFFNYEFGKLGYRTVTFESSVHEGDYQGTAQMNFCDEEIPYTRITEHKHFTPWEKHEKTVIFKEFSKETTVDDIPFYPKRLKTDKILLEKYRQKAETLSNTSFLGRLATYRYLDMDDVIFEAIDFSKKILKAKNTNKKLPVFPNNEK